MASSEPLLLPWLHFDLVEDILYKTAAESLIRFKSTCKQWYNLITERRFVYNHLDHSPERFIRSHNHERIHILDPVTENLSVLPIPADEFRVPDPIYRMVHCDGLMLCLWSNCYYRPSRNTNLAVWNPILREIKWIPSVLYRNTDYFGIGYDNTSRDNYKILRVGHTYFSKPAPKCEIYDFNSVSWRVIDAALDLDVHMEYEGVSVKGNMYWIAAKKEHFILSFDFSMETFKDICVCPSYWEIKRLGCFNGDRLSLLQQDEETLEIHVSVTKRLSDGDVSFSRYFKVTLPGPDLPLLQREDTALPGWCIGKHRNIMAWCEQHVDEGDEWYTCMTLYEIDEGEIRKQSETGRHELIDYDDLRKHSYVYVPSLIPLLEQEVAMRVV